MRTTARRAPRRPIRALGAPALAALLGAAPFAAPAAAHGGQQQVGVVVKELTVSPTEGRWVATLSLAALETADHLSNADASLAAGSAAPVALVQTETPGLYRGTLPRSAAGATKLVLTVRSLPGGALVRPFDAAYPGVTLAGASPVTVVGADAGGGGSTGGIAAGTAAGLFVLGGVVVVLRRRGAGRLPVTAAAAH